MPAARIHLVRHGEVFNPDGVLYGRLPGFGLSERGRAMAEAAAEAVAGFGTTISRILVSPLQRAQESAAPFAERFGLPVETDERLIEPTNRFEGLTFEFGPAVILRPRSWPWVINPWRPSWGEPYREVVARMMAAIAEAHETTSGGDVVMVSHQMPIWMVHRHLAGEPLIHDPRRRRCTLSSVTSLEFDGSRFVEVAYLDAAAELLSGAVDEGAV